MNWAEVEDKFHTHQELQCLFCKRTIEAIPAGMRGKKSSYRDDLRWYANGVYQTGAIFALCPEHQTPKHYKEAWDWAKGD